MPLGDRWSRVLNPLFLFLSKGSLRNKIIVWSFVPTAIILVTVALVNLYAYQRVTESLVIERDQELTRLSASLLATELSTYTDPLADQFLTVFDGDVVIFDAHGTILAAESGQYDGQVPDWSKRISFRQVFLSSEPVFSDVVTEGSKGEKVVVVAMPIPGRDGEAAGGIAGLFRLGPTTDNALYSSIEELRRGESNCIYVVDGNGRVIYHSDPDHIGDDFSRQTVVQQVLRGEAGALRTQDFDGRDIVASFAPVPDTSWGLVTEESWTALFSSSQRYGQFLLLLLALGVVTPTLIVTVGVRRIVQPIMELITAAQEVAEGDFGRRITASTGDELEELAEQFNLMAAQLQESYAHLEKKVVNRTKELATLNAIATKVSHSLDLEEILNDALDEALGVMSMQRGQAFRLEEETQTLILMAHRGLPEELVRHTARQPLGTGAAGWAAREGHAVVRKVADDSEGKLKELVKKEGLQLVISIPLMAKGRTVGAIDLLAHTLRSVTPEELSLLAAIGHQIGVAVENARLFEAERGRRREATLLAEMANLTSSTLDLEQVLHLAAEYAVDIFDVNCCSILLYDQAQGTLRLRAEAQARLDDQVTDVVAGAEFSPSEKVCQTVLEELEPLIVEDVPSEPLLSPSDFLTLQAALMVPIEIGGRVLGAMRLGTRRPRQRRFTSDEKELAMAMANQAAMAIENARLYEQAQQLAVVKERNRLARDLHDSVTQALYGVTLYAEAAARQLALGDKGMTADHLREIRDTAQEALREMRLLIFELRLPILQSDGLVSALQARLEAVEGRVGLKTEFKVEGDGRFSPAVEEGLYRVAQEALNNALKHAHASSVSVRLRQNRRAVVLEVTDDGVGFDPATARERGGFGLCGMAERATRMGGELTVQSSPGKGTKVRVEVGG
jgi:nitrate/nitrite-specific signal transduction histidine kinase